jgi:predicted RNA binding protein YcfA (HicA-like mRNA interferase family)
VTSWPSTKARRVYAALLSVGWQVKRQSGSHRTLSRAGYPDFVFAFHDGEETGKHRGCTVRAWMCARAGAEGGSCQAAQLDRQMAAKAHRE